MPAGPAAAPTGDGQAGRRRLATASTGRSPSGRACRARPRRGRRRSSRRACGWRGGRSPASTARRRGRGPRRRRRGRFAISSPIRRIMSVGASFRLDEFGGARLEGRRRGSRAPRRPRGTARSVRVGDLADRLVQRQVRIFLRGARVDLVVDVGDVADIGDVRPARRDAGAAGTARRRRSAAGRCRCGRSRRPSARRHTCARSPDRSGRSPPSSASACCAASGPCQKSLARRPGRSSRLLMGQREDGLSQRFR